MKIKYFLIGLGSLLVTGGVIWGVSKLFGKSDENSETSTDNAGTKKESATKKDTTIRVGDIVSAKNPNGINVRRGQSTDATIIYKDIKGQIGKVVEIVDGVNAEGKKDGYKWCRIELDKPVTYNGGKYTIGYCRIDVLTK